MISNIMSRKYEYLFGPKHRLWKFPINYLSYVTPYAVSEKIAQIADHIFELSDKHRTVFDMFSGIGTDSVALSKYCKGIVCTEIVPERFEMLEHNIKLGNNSCIINKYNQDCCIDLDPSHNVSVVFFDPPWGNTFISGRNFKFEGLTLDNGQDIIGLATKMLDKYGMMIIKSPIKCESFDQEFSKDIVASYAFPKQRLKFLFLIRDNARP